MNDVIVDYPIDIGNYLKRKEGIYFKKEKIIWRASLKRSNFFKVCNSYNQNERIFFNTSYHLFKQVNLFHSLLKQNQWPLLMLAETKEFLFS